eukprot:Opistho-2@75929
MKLFVVFTLLLAAAALCAAQYDDDEGLETTDAIQTSDDDSVSSSGLVLEHAFGADAPFKRRGVITFKSLRGTSAVMKQDALTKADLRLLEALIIADGVYRVRVASHISATKANTHVMSFAKACLVAASEFEDSVTLHVEESGHIHGITYKTRDGSCGDSGMRKISDATFVTTVTLAHSHAGTECVMRSQMNSLVIHCIPCWGPQSP